jgi:hypothetical protein
MFGLRGRIVNYPALTDGVSGEKDEDVRGGQKLYGAEQFRTMMNK